LVGAGASVAVFFLAGPLFDMTLAGEKTLDEWVKLISLGLLSGLAGTKVLTNASYHLVEKIAVLSERVADLEKNAKVVELIRRADSLASDSRLEHALATYNEALSIAPTSEAALIGKAKVYAERSQWDKAINTVSRILEENPTSKRAYYHRARYKNMAGKYPKEEVLADLRTAVSLDAHYENYAALHDKYFVNLREDAEFRGIVE
jgi:tetratricopeptide (TPR) repeat protein